eukprot:CAMPEP_0116837300 /NCGR_PEP_ID=MMETSP0418-20121206/8576_1 /TAXON_ID=1158023 /ORGANISM="Astrosyne radiata, Strain 13vi08-1A" /LENGTH=298 /DNA_ID=CAMNT_0004467167 /DNA_START=206 /DNA_END=1102 /DNA_ORIENTATION=-
MTATGDTRTAGSICLLLQTALPCALFGRSATTQLILKGGTNATMAPQYDYWEHVFLPTIQSRFGIPTDTIVPTCIQRGYYPKGKGEVHVSIESLRTSLPLNPLVMKERGDVCRVYIRSFYTGKLPPRLAHGMAHAAQEILQPILGDDVRPRVDIVKEQNAFGNGTGILIVATTTTGCLLAGSALGSPKKHFKEVGTKAAEELVSTLHDGGCVDEWLQDQLVLFMALAGGTSELLTGSLTLHTQTAIGLAEQVCGVKFEITKLEEGNETVTHDEGGVYGKDGRIPGKHLVRCQGIGFEA